MPKTADVVIIGGGVMGCSLAYQLAKMGIRSTVLERNRLAAGASGATAGVIAPLWHLNQKPGPLLSLGMRSLDRFPALAGELLEAGIDPAFRQNGVLKLAFSQGEVDELRTNLAWQGELGMGLEWLDPEEVGRREPEVNPLIMGGVFSPREGHIQGQRYVEALAHAASRLGASIHEGMEVTGLVLEGTRVVGVRTAWDTITCNQTVLAAGPWSGIPGRWLPNSPGQGLPVRPVKGQRILLKKPGFMPRCPVRNFDAYVVPQTDGNLLVGATREEDKFDEITTVEGISQMLAAAVLSFPSLKDAELVGTRAGVRPGTPDDAPVIGPVPGWEGFGVLSGHDHVGIMLSPASAELMANFINTGDPRPLEPFRVDRF